jgi:hypothetical protein
MIMILMMMMMMMMMMIMMMMMMMMIDNTCMTTNMTTPRTPLFHLSKRSLLSGQNQYNDDDGYKILLGSVLMYSHEL